ncbi:MAG TPA: hypothetical protein VL354_19025 [Spirochaetia bacterium]|nr:hypothetical protein [Spirochaetia bacterium]
MVESRQREGGKALRLEEGDTGKSGIEELVQGLAAGLGVDPMKLVFKWDRTPLVLQEHGLKLDQDVLTLRIYLGRTSETLSFSEELVRSSVENTFAFISKYTDYVIGALRRLKKKGAT